MVDIVSSEKRSQMMAGIKGKDTKPELLIRKALHKKGFRYRIHDKSLPGKPDIVLPKYKAVIFVHGCFWHAHSCHLFKWPSTKSDFWQAKISRNKELDLINFNKLLDEGWRIGIMWECAVKGKHKHSIEFVTSKITEWLLSDIQVFELSDKS